MLSSIAFTMADIILESDAEYSIASTRKKVRSEELAKWHTQLSLHLPTKDPQGWEGGQKK